MQPRTIRPGLLVSLKTSLSGGVDYQRVVIDPEHREGSASVEEWKTRREIADKEEHEAATTVRNKCRSVIVRPCSQTAFGLLCPDDREPALRAAMLEAQTLAADFNSRAVHTRVAIYAIMGRVAPDDAQAARAIMAEVRELLDDMERGVRSMDPERIRDAAGRARETAAMLTDDARAKVSAAIAEVRRVATDLVKAAKAGAVAADVIATAKLDALQTARFAVLDTDATAEVAPLPVAGVAIDFEPAAPMSAAPAGVPTLDLF